MEPDPQHGVGLTFSEALEQLKDGRKVYRAQWAEGKTPKDQWVVQQVGYPQGITLNHGTAQRTGLPEGSVQVFEPYYMMFTPWGSFTQWTPGAADLNADDWAIYYMPGEYERLCQEETDAILADKDLVAELEAAGKDPHTYTLEELRMVVELRKLEREDFPGDREAVRFRLLNQLFKPVMNNQHQLDQDQPPLPLDSISPQVAILTRTFVNVITKLNDDYTAAKLDLDSTKAKIACMEEFDRAWRNRYPVPEGLNSNDAILAYARIRCYQDGWKDTPGFTQTTWRLISTLLAPMLEEWRRELGPELGEGADGWKVVFPGLRVDGVDTIGSMMIELVPTPTAEEMKAFTEELARKLDPEATQQLVRPGDPDYPVRPQRLADVFRLRQTFDGETPAEGPRTIRRAAPDAEPTQVVKYFLNPEYGLPQVEVTEAEYQRAAQEAEGWVPGKPLPDVIMDGDVQGHIEYVPQ